MLSFRLQISGVALAAALAVTVGAAAADDRTAEDIRACSRANLPERTLVQEIELEAHDRAGGSQRRRAKFYTKRYPEHDETRSTLRVTSPIDVKGMAYLMIDRADADRLFLYLPAMQRVRRISGDSAAESLMGTDFSYADVRQLRSISAGGELERLEDATVGERPVYTLALTPAPEDKSEYRRIVFRVDRETCVPLRTEFHTAAEAPRKRLEADPTSLREIEGRWMATQMTMRDLRDGTHTTLEVLDASYDEGVSDIIFNPRTFHMGGAGGSPDSA